MLTTHSVSGPKFCARMVFNSFLLKHNIKREENVAKEKGMGVVVLIDFDFNTRMPIE